MTDIIRPPDLCGGTCGNDTPDKAGSGSVWTSGTNVGRAAVVLAGTGVMLAGIQLAGLPFPPCPLRWSTGIPCPLCGMTHVAASILSGRVVQVATHDPAALGLAVILAVVVVLQAVAMLRRTTGPEVLTRRAGVYLVVGLLGAHWLTTIVTGGMLTA